MFIKNYVNKIEEILNNEHLYEKLSINSQKYISKYFTEKSANYFWRKLL